MAMTVTEVLRTTLLQELYTVEKAFNGMESLSKQIMIDMNEITGLCSEVTEMTQLTSDLRKTKLQPSVVTMLSSVHGLESLSGINFSEVNNTNRNKMTEVACESLGAVIGSSLKTIKDKVVKVVSSIKNFLVRMVNVYARLGYAIQKIDDFMAKEFHNRTIDEAKFATKKFYGYDSTDFAALIKNTKALFAELLKAVSNATTVEYKWTARNMAGMKVRLMTSEEELMYNSKAGGGSYENAFEVTYDKKNSFPKKKGALPELNWTTTGIFKQGPEMKNLLHLAKEAENIDRHLFGLIRRLDSDITYAGYSTDEEIREMKKKARTLCNNMADTYWVTDACYSTGKDLVRQYIEMFNSITFKKKEA